MRKRDLDILKSLELYKCLTKSQLAALHFKNNSNPTVTANRVLLRLRNAGYILANTDRAFQEYIYFLNPSPIKINSQKLSHYLLINQTIIDMQSYSPISELQIETSLPQSEFIPDIYVKGWLDKNWFIECQNSLYTTTQLYTKLDRYVKYYESNSYTDGPFPNVLIIGEINLKFKEKEYPFVVRQVKSIKELDGYIKTFKERKLQEFKRKVRTPITEGTNLGEIKSEDGGFKIVVS